MTAQQKRIEFRQARQSLPEASDNVFLTGVLMALAAMYCRVRYVEEEEVQNDDNR